MEKEKLISFIKEILTAFEKSSASEIEVEDEGVRLVLRKKASPEQPISVLPAPQVSREVVEKKEILFGDNVYLLKSPMTGIFYRTPSPTSPPFVEEGDIVHKGQRLALIEAMKIFNDITAEISGRIVKIFPQNSSLVKEGDPLFAIEPMEELV